MIAIVNYGLGNIKAFANIYKKLSVPFVIASRPSDLINATGYILPGVGAFDSAMQSFNSSGLRPELEEQVKSRGKPVLGICVGMQMLAAGSEEGEEAGLNWIDGFVKRFDESRIPFRTKLPHMGWNSLRIVKESKLLADLTIPADFYFLHSYYFLPKNPSDVAAEATYGTPFPAIIEHNNVFGIQCHPEKSHAMGTRVLMNFASISQC